MEGAWREGLARPLLRPLRALPPESQVSGPPGLEAPLLAPLTHPPPLHEPFPPPQPPEALTPLEVGIAVNPQQTRNGGSEQV